MKYRNAIRAATSATSATSANARSSGCSLNHLAAGSGRIASPASATEGAGCRYPGLASGPRPKQRFYTVDRSISEDERLLWAARSMLVFLLGKPDNWNVSVEHLIKQMTNTEGKSSRRDADRVILKELKCIGYLVFDNARNSTRKFSGMAYTVYKQPITPQTEKPSPVAPQTDYPAPAFPAPNNPLLTSTDKTTSTDNPTKGSPNGSPVAMDFGDHPASSISSIHNNSSNGTGESFAATSAETTAELTIQ